MSTLEAQMTHAAWDAAMPYDMDEEARRNQFLATHMARRDADAERRRIKQEDEQEAEDGE